MSTLGRCGSCSGFVPSSMASCPHCEAAEPARRGVGWWAKLAGGGAMAVTMMACYGIPPEGPDRPGPPSEGADADAKDAQPDPSKAEPPNNDEPKADATKTEPTKTDETKAEPPKTDAPQ